LHGQLTREVRGERRFADPAFLVEQRYDHDALPFARRFIHSAPGLFIVSFIDSKLETKLRDAEIRAEESLSVDPYS